MTITILIYDNIYNTAYTLKSKNIKYISDKNYQGKIDYVLYIDQAIKSFNNNIKFKNVKKIALLAETCFFRGETYDIVENNVDKFDIIFTFKESILSKKIPNIYYNNPNLCFLNKNDFNIHEKNKLLSTVISHKRFLEGHKMRYALLEKIKNLGIVDIYHNNFIKLPREENGKINSLKDYMFQIVIENSNYNYYYTEKISDCFLTGTIPIYWGCPKISEIFNANGIITFETLNECVNIIKSLTKEDYESKLEYVKENYEIALKLENEKKFIDEEIILSHYALNKNKTCLKVE